MSMRHRERFVRKQCPPHRWKYVGIAACAGHYVIERKCDECSIVEHGSITPSEFGALPPTLVHLADIEWRA